MCSILDDVEATIDGIGNDWMVCSPGCVIVAAPNTVDDDQSK